MHLVVEVSHHLDSKGQQFMKIGTLPSSLVYHIIYHCITTQLWHHPASQAHSLRLPVRWAMLSFARGVSGCASELGPLRNSTLERHQHPVRHVLCQVEHRFI